MAFEIKKKTGNKGDHNKLAKVYFPRLLAFISLPMATKPLRFFSMKNPINVVPLEPSPWGCCFLV